MLIDNDTIIDIANEVHRAMPPDADDQQEMLAIVHEVLDRVWAQSPPPAGWRGAIERVRADLGQARVQGAMVTTHAAGEREFGGAALDAAIKALETAEAEDPKVPPDAVTRLGGRDKLLALARHAAQHSEERHAYLPADSEAAATFEPHAWVLQAMELAADAAVPEKDMHADMEIPMHDTVVNAVHRVYFRAGLLAMRELLARAVASRNPVLAAGLRTVWVPELGDDPGAPRQMNWGEIATGGEEGPWAARPDIDPSVEALPIALQFLEAEDCKPAGHVPIDDIRDVAGLVDVVLSMDLASDRGKVAKAIARKLAGIQQADPGGGPDDIVRCYQHLLDLLGASTHDEAAREIGRLHGVLLSKPMILKGVGRINGDGFKDTTKVGQVVYVWNAELPDPYSPGQFPRVGNDVWSASRDQFDFEPATLDEVRGLFAEWGKPSGVLQMEPAQ